MPKGPSSHRSHRDDTYMSAPAPNSFEFDDIGVKTATNGPDATWRPSKWDSLCLSDCDMKMEGCETNCTDCLKQYIFKMCCCGLAHTQLMHEAYADTRGHHVHNGKNGNTSDHGHHGRHGHHGHHGRHGRHGPHEKN